MKKLNNRGFTLVELLAVIVILGIMGAAASGAVTIYLSKTRNQAMETIASSAYDGAVMHLMENNIMLNKGESVQVTISQLYTDGRIERPADPYSTGKDCTGTVKVTNNTSSSTTGLEDYRYQVTVNCSGSHTKTMKYPK